MLGPNNTEKPHEHPRIRNDNRRSPSRRGRDAARYAGLSVLCGVAVMPCHDMEYWEEMKAEAAAEDRAARAYHARLMAHPDPRDPDYPGPDGDEDEDEA
jgi:hypothetical protein